MRSKILTVSAAVLALGMTAACGGGSGSSDAATVGKVGGLAAQFLHDAGCTVVAVSDVGGGVYDGSGLDTAGLLRHVRSGAPTVVGYPGTDTITNEELLELDVDVLVPAALEGVLHEENADRVRARFVVEGANGPTTPDADEILASISRAGPRQTSASRATRAGRGPRTRRRRRSPMARPSPRDRASRAPAGRPGPAPRRRR